MRKHRAATLSTAVVVGIGLLLPAAVGASSGSPSGDCEAWVPFIVRDLKAARAANDGAFPASRDLRLPDGLGNVVDVPWEYTGGSQTATLTPDAEDCAAADGRLPAAISLTGAEVDSSDDAGLGDGPLSAPAVASLPVTATPDAPARAVTPPAAPPAASPAPAPPAAAPPATSPPTTAPLVVTVAGGQAGICHPSYVGPCVPPNASDVNCDSIPMKNFRVVGPDEYHLDSDNDRTACEDQEGVAVAGTTQTAPQQPPPPPTPTDQLPTTGSTTAIVYYLALALLLGGTLVITASGFVPETARIRGGFTIVRTDLSGQRFETRVAGVRSRWWQR